MRGTFLSLVAFVTMVFVGEKASASVVPQPQAQTLDRLKEQSVSFLDNSSNADNVVHELKTDEEEGDVSVRIGGTTYYFTPQVAENASVLQALADIGSVALKVLPSSSGALYSLNGQYYGYDQNALPTSSYSLIEITEEQAASATYPVVKRYTKNSDNTLTETYYKVNISEIGSGNTTKYYKWEKDGEGHLTLVATTDADEADITVKYGKDGRRVYDTRQTSLSGDVDADFIGSYAQGNNASGGAILNTSTIGNITGDFIGNYAQGNKSAKGGAIYNYGTSSEALASVGNIEGNFIDNYAQSNGSEAGGGAIYNMNFAKIGDITGYFSGNYAKSASSEASGGAIYNFSNSTIGNITGDFIGNYAKSASSYAYGGAIYNYGGTTIGNITGDFIGNYAKSASSSAYGGAIYNYGSATIGDITGYFSGNNAKSASYAYGGAIYNFSGSKIGDITGNFSGNNAKSASSEANGGAINNTGGTTIGNITGDFSGNYAESASYAYGGAIYNANSAKIGDITGYFSGNNAKSASSSAYGGAIDNIYGSTIGKIEGGFSKNFALAEGGDARGGAIYNENYATIGDITGDFSENFVQSNGTTSNALVYGGAIYNHFRMGSISGIFKGNYAQSNGGEASGGAIYNLENGKIDDITGNFSENFAQSYGSTANAMAKGGAIYNMHNAKIGDITGDFSGNNAKSASSSAYGGAISNMNGSMIGNIEGDFHENFVQSYGSTPNAMASGGAIYNFGGTTIGNIEGDFTNNSAQSNSGEASGGAIYNMNGAKIGDITGGFSSNYAKSKSSHAYGGAIYNSNGSRIDNITGNFSENYALAEGITSEGSTSNANAYGGAIYNIYGGMINNITGNFSENYAQSNGGEARGGAIYNDNYATIGKIEGDFRENFVQSYGSTSNAMAFGGAIYNDTYDTISTSSGTASIGNIKGNFSKNYALAEGATSDAKAYGGAIYNHGTSSEISASVGNIEGNFSENYAQSDSGEASGGAIYNNNHATIGKIEGDFSENYAQSNSGAAYGGAIYNIFSSTIGDINGNFIGNYAKSASSLAWGGAIYNRLGGTIGDITGYFSGNNAESTSSYAEGGAIFNTNGATIGKIEGDFSENYAQSNSGAAYGGAIYNTSGGKIGNIEGNFSNNYVQSNGTTSNAMAYGGAIYNNNTMGSISGIFTGNYAQSNGGEAKGGAIYTTKDLNITASGTDALTKFSGNYVSTDLGATKQYEAIYVASAAETPTTLTFSATDGGTIQLDDYINGDEGYNLTMTADETSKILLNNVIKGKANATLTNVDVNWSGNDSFDAVEFSSLTSSTNSRYSLDIDLTSEKADTITAASGSGTITLDSLKITGGISNPTAEYKIQIIKGNSSLQLALSEALSARLDETEYELSRITKNGTLTKDSILADTSWDKIYKQHQETHDVVTYGKLGLAKTTTEKDSIGIEVTKVENENSQTISTTQGDTLKLVNQAEIVDENGAPVEKNFTTTDATAIYEVAEALGTTLGTLNIKGITAGDNKSTIDLNGKDGFALDNTSTALNLSNVKLTDSTSSAKNVITATTSKATIGIADSIINGNIQGAGNSISFSGISKLNGNITNSNTESATITVSGSLELDGGISGNGTTIFESGSTLTVNTGTTKIANTVVNKGATLNLKLDNDSIGKYQMITGSLDNEFDITENNLYNIVADDTSKGTYNISKKSSDEVAAAVGATGNQASTITAITNGNTTNETFNTIANNISSLIQSGNSADVKTALDASTSLAPEVAPVVRYASTETTNQVFGAVGTRLSGGSISSASQGMSSGDSIFKRGAVWVQGLVNKSKLNDTSKAKGFDADTNGVAFGAEKFVNDDVKLGVGYAYSQTDIDGFMRSTDVDTHTAIVYVEYKPSNWYVNGIATYGWSEYSENKSVAGVGVKADYDVDTFGLQAMSGYDMNIKGFVVTPEAGLRYVHIKQDSYKDSADQKVSGNDSDILTAVIGAKVSKSWEMSNGMNIKPEARIAATYDLMNDNVNSVVTLANGSAYAVKGEALERFGMEFGVGVTAEVNDNVELSLGYEGKFRKDYQDHTGLVNTKYKF